MSDPFATGALRAAVTTAWAASPARFREDANAEEDLARGHYRDRVVVELAQNAADAADAAAHAAAADDAAGALLLELRTADDGTPLLLAANTGTPLTPEGLASMASLRASAKRSGGAVGRFGVGFAAVRSVADEIAVLSGPAAVHFSVAETAAVVSGLPGLADEAAARAGVLPALRLPFEGPGTYGAAAHDLLDRWDTVVVLALRDAAALEAVRAELAAVDDVLLLALPRLARVEVVVDGGRRVVEDVADRWVAVRRTGTLPESLLADRPVEERGRTAWHVTWAVPRPGSGVTVPAVVHAPTPTDEPSTLPALLLADLPLDPARRHVAPGPLTDAVVAHAAEAWADLLLACRDDGPPPLSLVPHGFPAGALDAALRTAVVEATRDVPLLRPAGGGPHLRPRDAVVLDGPVGEDPEVTAALGRTLPALVRVDPAERTALRTLGVERVELAEVVDGLPVLDAAGCRALYDAVAGLDATGLEQLATLPVLLADGRTVRGARGTVLLDQDLPAAALVGWGLRVVDPVVAHPVLERLGARRVGAADLLADPTVRDRVLHAEDDHAEVAEVVLGLVARTGTLPQPWWGELLLPDDAGDPAPARTLVVPGSDAARWFDDDVLPPVTTTLVDRWGPEVLTRVGVRSGLVVETVDGSDAELVTQGLDGWEDYQGALADLDVDPEGPLSVVADLDAVREETWPEVLRALGTGPARAALLSPVQGGGRTAPSYTAWWLREHRGPGRPFAVPGHPTGVEPLLAPAPEWAEGVDPAVLTALGGVADLDHLDDAAWVALLDALPPVLAPVDVAVAVRVWRALARRTATEQVPTALADVACLPALVGEGHTVVVPAEEVAVADPMWAQHPGVSPVLVVPTSAVGALADALDLDVAAERSAGAVTSRGQVVRTPDVVTAAFPGAPVDWVEHDDLRVDGRSMTWWVERGTVHAATTGGLARGLAHLIGWEHRDRLERLLTEPGSRDVVLLDLAGDDGV